MSLTTSCYPRCRSRPPHECPPPTTPLGTANQPRRLEASTKEEKETVKSLKTVVDSRSLLLLSSGAPASSSSSSSSSSSAVSSSHRSRLSATTSKLDNSTATVTRTLALLGEIEETGGEIASELQSNRDKINSAQAKAKDVSGMMNIADKMTTSMSKWWK